MEQGISVCSRETVYADERLGFLDVTFRNLYVSEESPACTYWNLSNFLLQFQVSSLKSAKYFLQKCVRIGIH